MADFISITAVGVPLSGSRLRRRLPFLPGLRAKAACRRAQQPENVCSRAGLSFRFNTSALPKRPCFRSRAAWMNSRPRGGTLLRDRTGTARRVVFQLVEGVRLFDQPGRRHCVGNHNRVCAAKRSDRQPTPRRRRSTGGSICRPLHSIDVLAIPVAGEPVDWNPTVSPHAFIWVAVNPTSAQLTSAGTRSA